DLQHALVEFLDIPKFRCSVGQVTDAKSGASKQTQRPFLAPSFAPAGSTQMMTAIDLVTFARALVDGGVGPNGARILTDASAVRMATASAASTSTPSSARQVGLGWMILPGGLLYHG